MRALIPGLENPHPMVHALPAVYQELVNTKDDFLIRFVESLDEVLAPLYLVLDNVDAYLDPALTPPDFLPWLAEWVGVELDENWTEEQQRRLIGQAVEIYRWRGTIRGVRETIKAWLQLDDDAILIRDSGGVTVSNVPSFEEPDSRPPTLAVRVAVTDADSVDPGRLERLVGLATPAHVAYRVEVVSA